MNWDRFRRAMFDLGCFSLHHVYAWDEGFDRNNLVRWIRRGYLLRLRREWHTFAEYRTQPDMEIFFAEIAGGRSPSPDVDRSSKPRPRFRRLESPLIFCSGDSGEQRSSLR